ncbi:hypothetical protein [Halobacillus yeomjeoni]|uniref:Uncharacterized protein n=1 Tax=Halobacillus yeomjeoni TaxID=311194 RepID=A0A931HT68_9BACI|nr:hypothetical protein [Halobacillus yeomjeoni]MBH0229162.1 hypothetical protein [Halobacillus yeomjeoni]
MRTRTKMALAISLIVWIGFPVLFFFISLNTNEWNYLILSIPGSFTAGFTGLMLTIHHHEKDHQS